MGKLNSPAGTSELHEAPLAPQGYDASGRVLLTPNNERRVPVPPKKSIFVPTTVPVAVPDGSNHVRIEHIPKKEKYVQPHQRVLER